MSSSSVKVQIKPDFRKINEELKTAIGQALGLQLQAEQTEIKTRTRQGRDVDGAPFPDLSPSYKAFKVEKGRTGTPNLSFTGAMLQGMSSGVQRVGSALVGTITMGADQAAKALGHLTGTYFGKKTGKVRNFFGLSEKQKKRLIETINTAMTQPLHK